MIEPFCPPSWPSAPRTSLPPVADLPAFLDGAEFDVPPRGVVRRRTPHEEGFCIIRALRWLGRHHPEAFPAELLRQEAPDFVVMPKDRATPWAFEHTNAGEREYQHWLAKTENLPGAHFIPSPKNNGWLGNAPEQAFAVAIGGAIGHKANPNFWRNAPPDGVRCILLHDQANTSLFVSEAVAEVALASAVAAARAAHNVPILGMLLRGTTKVVVAGEAK